ncbi:MAG: cell envelope integrity protein CreD, partial [Chitinophagaceae bacterium]
MFRNALLLRIVLRHWLCTASLVALCIVCYLLLHEESIAGFVFWMVWVASLIASVPVLVSISIFLFLVNRTRLSWQRKFWGLIGLQFLLSLPYGILAAVGGLFRYQFFFGDDPGFVLSLCAASGFLFCCATIVSVAAIPSYYHFFNINKHAPEKYSSMFQQLFFNHIKPTIMNPGQTPTAAHMQPNKILIKGLVTGVLILIMLIPTIFIVNLVEERETRQKEVVKEVSSKWATAQTLSAPFLAVPYVDTFLNSEGKAVATKTNLILLSNELLVDGKIIPEERTRSIYKVLLYKTDINFSGHFKVSWPADVQLNRLDFSKAKLCFSLSDFKGIEEEIFVDFGGQRKRMIAGLPVENFGKIGLSVPVQLTPEVVAAGIAFSMHIKVKGSEQLHFIPLSAASKYNIRSAWPSPSFDGEMLPNQRAVNDSGFSARWNFTQANLPFASVMRSSATQANNMAFGVSLVQPADQYDKTERSVKYAILVIGLTFGLFFIMELTSSKPFHPVQYMLVGMALVIFYTLLLSISEFINFDYAYLLAASATIILVTWYAKGHFKSWRSAAIFATTLTMLYGFIFILLRLEDTALLAGSLG